MISLSSSSVPWLNRPPPSNIQDMILITNDKKRYRIDRTIFASHSVLTPGLLRESSSEEDTIVTAELSSNDFNHVLAFMYTGCLPLEMGPELIKAFATMGIGLHGKQFVKVVKKMVKEKVDITIRPNLEEDVKSEEEEEEETYEGFPLEDDPDPMYEELDDLIPDVLLDEDEKPLELKRPLTVADMPPMPGDKPKKKKALPEDMQHLNEPPKPKAPQWAHYRPGTCTKCDKSVRDIVYHNELYHSEANCDHCDKKFPNKVKLNKHMSRAHKFVCCELCGKVLANEDTYKDHMIGVHGNPEDREFKCELCPKAFVRKAKLDIHMEDLHGSGPKQRLYCDKCGADFASKSRLQIHIKNNCKRSIGKGKSGLREFKSAKTLHPYVVEKLQRVDVDNAKCIICDASFTGIGNALRAASHIYSLHMEDKDKPFQCNICGKGFARKHTLSYHMEMHNDKRDYICSFCNKGFNTLGNRNSHEREVHLSIKKGSVAKARRNGPRKKPVETPEERRERWRKHLEEKGEEIQPMQGNNDGQM